MRIASLYPPASLRENPLTRDDYGKSSTLEAWDKWSKFLFSIVIWDHGMVLPHRDGSSCSVFSLLFGPAILT